MALLPPGLTLTITAHVGPIPALPDAPDSLPNLVADLIAEVGYQVAARLEEQANPQPRNEAELEALLAGYRARGKALLHRGGRGTA